ncbi:MAG: hypothetical protein COB35_07865 [Gammaproteobacteria bacterium]|nr:MAG: hypothetical protein COB35_07865 [Gammaproteobacteria bacterium]
MPRKSKQPIDRSSLLQSCDGTLAKIAAKTNYLKKLTAIVRQICPDIPVEAYQIANFHQSAIIIEVKSSVWSQRLQFERVKISQALNEMSEGLFTKIEIKVNPHNNKAIVVEENIQHRYHRISKKSAQHLENLAKSVPESLKIKLQRLARLAK